MANKDSSSPTRVDGRVQVPGSDLHVGRKQTLGDYLRDQTKGEDDLSTANKFPIDFGSVNEVSSGPQEDGAPTPLTRMEDNQQPHFSFENEAREIFNSVSSGAFFDNYPNSGRQIEAIAAAAGVSQSELKNSQVVGHNMGTSDMVKTISEQVSSVLLNNRFSPPPDEILSSESHAGFNEKNEDYKQIYYGSERNTKDMAKLGVESVLAGSGYSGKNAITDSESGVEGIWAQVFEDFQIDNVGNNANGLIGIEQDRLRDGTRRVSEKATLPSREWLDRSETGAENITLDYVDNQGASSDEQGSAENHSYTVMNNMVSKFVQEELFSSRQYVNGLTFMAAIFVENILLAAIFDALLLAEFIAIEEQRANLKSQYNNEAIQMAKGKARGNSVPISELLGGGNEKAADIMELFGIPDLQSVYSGPFLVEFIMNFMGINKPIQTKTNFTVGNFKIGNVISFVPSYLIGSLQTTISALKDPFSSGFFFNLGRQIARQSALAEAPKPESLSMEYINYFSKLRDQANFRFFITMVNLGDNAIGQFAAKQRHASGPSILNETRKNWNGTQINPGSVRATPSMFLIPKSFQNFREDVGLSRFKSGVSVYDGVDATTFKDFADQFYDGPTDDSGSGRIPDDIVREIEGQLNNEYMPFYIKDMRTNEIISFHAFLDSLSDGFSATYSQTQGMGRIEAAQTYESSSRAIGLSFTMMAFSKEDMDMLYWKLNKLVTLLYPQFSKGTKLVGADKEFYMPFSQIQTASPMIRLRVGDVLTNNYSTASASRLLGLGDEDLSASLADKPAGMGFSFSKPTPREVDGFMAGIFLKSLTPKVNNILGPKLLQSQTNLKIARQTDIVKINSSISTKIKYGIVVLPATPLLAATIKNTTRLFSAPMRLEKEDTFKIIGFEAHKDGLDKSSVWLVAEEIDATSGQRNTTVDYLASTGNIPTKQCFKVPLSDITEMITNSAIEEKALEFIKENTIIKSFENNFGEGIAGFIDNLQIDWQLNNIMWGTEKGNRAPTGCKITLGFKPIHDITPGIDADGFNRAPVYKVGNLSNGVHKGGALNPKNNK